MRFARDDADDRRREDLVALRFRQTEQLVQTGFRQLVDGEVVSLPVLEFWGREGRNSPDQHFLAINGRVVVENRRIGEAREVLGGRLGEPIGNAAPDSRFAILELLDTPVVQALDELRERGIPTTPQHLVFPTGRSKGQEGEDPEPADPRDPRRAAQRSSEQACAAVVAVLDTGLSKNEVNEPWFQGIDVRPDDVDPLRVFETGFTKDGEPIHDLEAGHGTMVTGIIREIAPDVGIATIRTLNTEGLATDDQVAAAILRCLDEERAPDIINLSLGCQTADDEAPPVIVEAIQRVLDKLSGAVVVAAAGNYFSSRPVWPAAFSHERLVAVAALDQRGDDPDLDRAKLAWYSSFGDHVRIAAPGTWAAPFVIGAENPLREPAGGDEPDFFKGYAEAAGTSMATAAISGALAMELCALDPDRKGGATAADALEEVLRRAGNRSVEHRHLLAIDVWND